MFAFAALVHLRPSAVMRACWSSWLHVRSPSVRKAGHRQHGWSERRALHGGLTRPLAAGRGETQHFLLSLAGGGWSRPREGSQAGLAPA